MRVSDGKTEDFLIFESGNTGVRYLVLLGVFRFNKRGEVEWDCGPR